MNMISYISSYFYNEKPKEEKSNNWQDLSTQSIGEDWFIRFNSH